MNAGIQVVNGFCLGTGLILAAYNSDPWKSVADKIELELKK